jgi:ABC-2 type transport system permease protein
MLRTIWAEWGKTWSVRAPWACLLTAAALVLVTATSLANDFVHGFGTGERPPGATMPLVDAVGPALQFGQLVFATFALQLITAEYSTGSISATLRAQPRRHLVVLSKAAIAAGCGLVVGALLGALSDWASRLVLGDYTATGGQSLVEVAVRSGTLLALVAVLVVGLGAALRSAVGTLAAVTVVLLATLALPSSAGRWAPGQAGATWLAGASDPYPTEVGLLVVTAWAAAALVVALWLVERRDS